LRDASADEFTICAESVAICDEKIAAKVRPSTPVGKNSRTATPKASSRPLPSDATCPGSSICLAAIAARITPVKVQPIAQTRLIIAP